MRKFIVRPFSLILTLACFGAVALVIMNKFGMKQVDVIDAKGWDLACLNDNSQRYYSLVDDRVAIYVPDHFSKSDLRFLNIADVAKAISKKGKRQCSVYVWTLPKGGRPPFVPISKSEVNLLRQMLLENGRKDVNVITGEDSDSQKEMGAATK